ncbi:substrate-binding domain-containing protein [Brevibacillus sp. MCWH]|jgi:ribose transport system substrate-binding protein|uniref:substrate-binding domain-containing protein n=1 Tax=Brevibacillus sp. MCWH TaxID=2508871 RepID=UPI000E39CB48|nr:substrate-binding domain-containing protein [Brevibacillus sp. MCWH]NNV03171.1 ABC transporter substrate-binding protein [Brevibacillus sp. MCWH]REK65493.1 MAG: ABC transporter substrate-binding protein [Brevibacillus sp.]
MHQSSKQAWRTFVYLLLAAAAVLGACADPAADQVKQKNVALIVRMKHGDYWRTVKWGAEMAAREFGVNVNFYAPDYEEDVKGQLAQVRQAFADGTAAVVIAPDSQQVLDEATSRAKEQRIPVLIIDSELTGPGVVSWIGTDHVDSGKRAGEKLIELVGTHGRIAVLGGGNTAQREKGLLEAISHYPGVTIVAREGASDQNQASELVARMIDSHSLDGIVALNAVAALGAAQAIESKGLAEKVKVVAIDSPPDVLAYIQEGVIQATIMQNPFSMGYLGVKHAVEAMNGLHVPSRIDTGTKIIDMDNMFWSENQKLLFPFVK